jgi:hypothetical protein
MALSKMIAWRRSLFAIHFAMLQRASLLRAKPLLEWARLLKLDSWLPLEISFLLLYLDDISEAVNFSFKEHGAMCLRNHLTNPSVSIAILSS